MTKSNLWKKVFLLAHDSKGFRVYYNYSKEAVRAWYGGWNWYIFKYKQETEQTAVTGDF